MTDIHAAGAARGSGATARRGSDPIDVEGLATALAARTTAEVRFGAGDRHLYATDASNFRQVPIGVVVPRTIDDVVATHEICREFGAPITNRGGGTSLAGQATNVAVIVDSSKYLRAITALDPDARTVTCQPGIVLDTLLDHVQSRARLTWGPDPATHNRCTVGGMIGNNACGMRAFRYGRTEDNVEELDVLLHDGTRLTVGPTSEVELAAIIAAGGRRGRIYAELKALRDRYADTIRERFPDIPRRVSGYNLTQLLPENGFNVARALVGTEGTCVTVLHATLNLNHYFPQRALLVLGYRDVYAAADHVAWLRRHADAIAMEGIDRRLVDHMAEKRLHPRTNEYLPDGDGWLMIEFGGETRDEANEKARALVARLRDEVDDPPAVRLYASAEEEAIVWGAREAGLGAAAHFQGTDSWPGWEDSAVHPDDLGRYLRDLRGLFGEYGYHAALYGHFGDGCIHCRIDFDLTSRDGIATYTRFLHDAAELVSAYGGSYSGEHGDGQQRGALLEQMYGPEIHQAFREFKSIWDRDNRMNPGKVVDPYGVDEHLRLGPDFRLPVHVDLKFGYPHDGGSFSRAQMRCVGVGACRRDDGGGTMCPSYMVTHDETHSTRGRARLLFEMLKPDSELEGWRDASVREALDLCLSCKGCVTDCPVNVDIPTYKAEFLHHHYDGRVRPRIHYALGWIDRWARLASRFPGVANGALGAPVVGRMLKRAAGIAPQRQAPAFAHETFRRWFEGRAPRNVGAPRVLLFPDTFTDHLAPEIGKATVAVLEDAGYRVTLPRRPFCCGRPLYDYGMLDRAHRYLDRLIAELREDVADGATIVGMEPSCIAVFRDELVQMKPHDVDARRIADATMDLAGFLTDVADYDFPTLGGRAIVHGHCHQKGVYGLSALSRALDRLGLDWEELDAGCCGLAGAFGFEAGERFDVSVAAGERKLLPAVRDADPATLVIADGFSCRTQIEHLQAMNGAGVHGPRRALHLAEVIAMAHAPAASDDDNAGGPVEQRAVRDSAPRGGGPRGAVGLVAGVAGLLAAAAGWYARRRRRTDRTGGRR